MIRVSFMQDHGTFSMSVQDHADPLVCAGCSALTSTLGGMLEDMDEGFMLEEEPVLHEEEGNSYVSCRPYAWARDTVRWVFLTIQKGFLMMEEDYRGQVQVTDMMEMPE